MTTSKLVITYNTGEYESCYDHVVCLEYESPEAFIQHFDEKLESNMKVIDEYEKEVTLLNEKRANCKPEQWREFHKQICEWQEKMTPHQTIEIAGVKFQTYDFYYQQEMGKTKKSGRTIYKRCKSLPNVQTLDEWFDANLKENY